jgi:hypothetical protein
MKRLKTEISVCGQQFFCQQVEQRRQKVLKDGN